MYLQGNKENVPVGNISHQIQYGIVPQLLHCVSRGMKGVRIVAHNISVWDIIFTAFDGQFEVECRKLRSVSKSSSPATSDGLVSQEKTDRALYLHHPDLS